MTKSRLDLFTRLLRALLPEVDPRPPEHVMPMVLGLSGDWPLVGGVRVQVVNHLGFTMVVAKPIIQIPDLYLSPPILKRAAAGLAPEQPTTRDLLADPNVSRALPGELVYATADQVQWRTNDPNPESLAAFIHALEASRVRPWQDLAARLGLSIDERSLSIFGHTGGLRALSERFDIRIREERRHTRIRIALAPGLPDNFKIRPGTPTEAQKLHHPILDRQLVCEGLTGDLRRKILSVHEPLLTLIAEGGDSDINATRIRVVRPGRLLSDLEPLLEDALAVVRALS